MVLSRSTFPAPPLPGFGRARAPSAPSLSDSAPVSHFPPPSAHPPTRSSAPPPPPQGFFTAACGSTTDVIPSPSGRKLSLPHSVRALGADGWNAQPQLAQLIKTLDGACTAKTVAQALAEVRGIMTLGDNHNLWAYAYLRMLYNKHMKLPDVYYATLLADPTLLLPVAYTPTVGEACQKFGLMPFYPRGCYVSLSERGNVKAVLEEYARSMLPRKADGTGWDCECIVFSDGGRILGLGDLGTFGMGIPVGKLDLYTACGGFNPAKTVPVILDAGIGDASKNTANLDIRGNPLYTGMKKDRVKHTSAAGTEVNSAYYGVDSFVGEFMSAARDLFGKGCLLQFEDFNTNDAFPLLDEYRNKFLCYNDDIQGTASIAVGAILGGIKVQNPKANVGHEIKNMNVLLHGSGSANLGAANLLINEAGVPASQVMCTNSRGLIWKSADGSEGTFRNDEQKAVAQVGKPTVKNPKDLVELILAYKIDAIIGAVGRDPGCFNKEVVEAMCKVADEKGRRPIIFALSNPKTQAEITAHDAYTWSNGKALFGSGTRFENESVQGQVRKPGQVNNFFIFPGTSYGSMLCEATHIPEKFFMVAAEAVANTLDQNDIAADSVVPAEGRIREVSLNVATAIVLEAQKEGIAGKTIGDDEASVKAFIKASMWSPKLAR